MIVGTATIQTAIDTNAPPKNCPSFVGSEPARDNSYATACQMSLTTSTPIAIASARDHFARTASANPSAAKPRMTGIQGARLGPGTQSSSTAASLFTPLCSKNTCPTLMRWNSSGADCTIGGGVV